MGREALLESLRGKAAADREAVWREARAAADAYRAELARVAEAERAKYAQAAAALTRRMERETTAEARRRAREARAEAALGLAERCRRLAAAELPRLRQELGGVLFSALAAELPAFDWQRVQVNPADADLARSSFPAAQVVCDAAISGGMTVDAAEGRIQVSNTLDTRLAMAWPDILPGLIGTLLPESRDDAAAA
jgi:vacuolar-type H+-ATPase subunit E/Vma4